MNPYDAISLLTLLGIAGCLLVIGYAIAERDRKDETFPDGFWVGEKGQEHVIPASMIQRHAADEAIQRDPRPDELAGGNH